MDTQQLSSFIDLLENAFQEDGNNSISWWNIIRDGYNEKIDQYRKIISESRKWLWNYQKQLIESTKINTLRIKFTQNSWYFIEISKSHIHKVSHDFIHVQTLVNTSRFITQELKNFEWNLIEAEQNMAEEEYRLFLDIREEIISEIWFFHKISKNISHIDFSSTLSSVAKSKNYIRPNLHEGFDVEIIWWRHPVIESLNCDFVSNDMTLSQEDCIHIITWPNMWWKSTYLRQNALIIILSHIWSYIPAKKASIPLVDRVFSRVGAYDNLYLWQSTFMVEMQEISNILHNASKKSFVIVDEIGRGTSTYDGMSLAWAILKYLHDETHVKALFATHYHEITDMSHSLTHTSNYSVAVWENDENIIFLRKIVPWSMKKSYGIEVARIAGIPRKILQEARKVMEELQRNHNLWSNQMNLSSLINEQNEKDLNVHREIIEKIELMNLENTPPIEALKFLYEIQKKIEK